MQYLEATILACCQMCLVVPVAAPHKLSHDTIFHGFKIPSNNNCFMCPNLYSVHMDKNLFANPENFDPGHFLSSRGQVINTEYVIPFSDGRSKCVRSLHWILPLPWKHGGDFIGKDTW